MSGANVKTSVLAENQRRILTLAVQGSSRPSLYNETNGRRKVWDASDTCDNSKKAAHVRLSQSASLMSLKSLMSLISPRLPCEASKARTSILGIEGLLGCGPRHRRGAAVRLAWLAENILAVRGRKKDERHM